MTDTNEEDVREKHGIVGGTEAVETIREQISEEDDDE